VTALAKSEHLARAIHRFCELSRTLIQPLRARTRLEAACGEKTVLSNKHGGVRSCVLDGGLESLGQKMFCIVTVMVRASQ